MCTASSVNLFSFKGLFNYNRRYAKKDNPSHVVVFIFPCYSFKTKKGSLKAMVKLPPCDI